jgi:hypothetical protein
MKTGNKLLRNLFLILGFLVGGLVATGQVANPIAVTAASVEPASVEPGEVITVIVTLTNNADATIPTGGGIT